MEHLPDNTKIELTPNQKHYFALQGSINLAGNQREDLRFTDAEREKIQRKFHILCMKLRCN